MNKIKSSAETAIKLDSFISESYCSLGFYYVCFEWNWKKAKENFLKSLELNPNNAHAHYWYGWNYLGWVEGDFNEAEKHCKEAIKLEPLSAICFGIYARILLDCGNFREALEISQKGLELEPNSYLCQIDEAQSYLFLRDYEMSVESFHNALKISNRHHFAMNGLIWAYCKLGKYVEAKELLDELRERSKKEYIGLTFTAISAAYLDELDFAFECLENAVKQLDPIIVTVKNENWFPAELTQDTRFQSIIDRVYSNHLINE